jgi:hypothetical protein
MANPHVLKRTLQQIDFGYEDDPAEFVITKTKIMTIERANP